jgi:predicted amidophosphoribosyltransferase
MIYHTHCPNCTAQFGLDVRFCTKCGFQVELDDPVVCPRCRTPISMWNEACTQCGAPIEKPWVTLSQLEIRDGGSSGSAG